MSKKTRSRSSPKPTVDRMSPPSILKKPHDCLALSKQPKIPVRFAAPKTRSIITKLTEMFLASSPQPAGTRSIAFVLNKIRRGFRAFALSPRSWRRCDLAVANLFVAHGRLRLWHLKLSGRRSDIRHARRFRCAGRHGACEQSEDYSRSSTEQHIRPAHPFIESPGSRDNQERDSANPCRRGRPE
jgi:hypothetical protein